MTPKHSYKVIIILTLGLVVGYLLTMKEDDGVDNKLQAPLIIEQPEETQHSEQQTSIGQNQAALRSELSALMTAHKHPAASTSPYVDHAMKRTAQVTNRGRLEFIHGSSILLCNIDMQRSLHLLKVSDSGLDSQDDVAQWMIDKPELARVENGKLHCLKTGTTAFKVRASGLERNGRIEVVNSPVMSLYMDVYKGMQAGKSGRYIHVYAHLANNQQVPLTDVKLSLSDTSLASVNVLPSGRLQLLGLAAGTVRLSAYWNGFSAQQDITIIEAHPLPEIIRLVATEFRGKKIVHPVRIKLNNRGILLRLIGSNGKIINDVPPHHFQWSISNPEILQLKPMILGSTMFPSKIIAPKKTGVTDIEVRYGSIKEKIRIHIQRT